MQFVKFQLISQKGTIPRHSETSKISTVLASVMTSVLETGNFYFQLLALTKCGLNGNQTFYKLPTKRSHLHKTLSGKKKSPWISAELKKHMHNRDVTKIKAIKSNNPHDWANYKRMRNQVNTEIKSAKRLFYTNIAKECDKSPLGNVNKEKSLFSIYLCIILEVGTFFSNPCGLLLQKTYSSAVG